MQNCALQADAVKPRRSGRAWKWIALVAVSLLAVAALCERPLRLQLLQRFAATDLTQLGRMERTVYRCLSWGLEPAEWNDSALAPRSRYLQLVANEEGTLIAWVELVQTVTPGYLPADQVRVAFSRPDGTIVARHSLDAHSIFNRTIEAVSFPSVESCGIPVIALDVVVRPSAFQQWSGEFSGRCFFSLTPKELRPVRAETIDGELLEELVPVRNPLPRSLAHLQPMIGFVDARSHADAAEQVFRTWPLPVKPDEVVAVLRTGTPIDRLTVLSLIPAWLSLPVYPWPDSLTGDKLDALDATRKGLRESPNVEAALRELCTSSDPWTRDAAEMAHATLDRWR